jgi:hypothetical protein
MFFCRIFNKRLHKKKSFFLFYFFNGDSQEHPHRKQKFTKQSSCAASKDSSKSLTSPQATNSDSVCLLPQDGHVDFLPPVFNTEKGVGIFFEPLFSLLEILIGAI